MVYIDRNGRIVEKRPWDLARIKEIFAGLWFVIVQFFLTLLAPFKTEKRGGGNNRRGDGWGSGGGYGGGGGSGAGGGNGGFRPNRRIGRIANSMDCNIPGGG